CLQYFSSPYTF
nr:immunoglobulin light chain junction region [Macaca mulatta]MOV64951.1 immunoglobulin light chain junction region [Macaca mulatta]